ncbi:histone-lysine N-methyltransferase PRDM9-like [Centropristis striata]|uniref:histone-lysine N-methyltransferase PRDM9-like n=1 Tax=Centropristis striata TaxID=184440 RepID=UPI0027DEDE58|nr:histone-lysine N-methyltransferase PRDM9-like [Centropristis striata]
MSTLQHLNSFISERLSAAAVEIFGAVEKTLTQCQGEISRSKQEIDHLRTLVLWPQVKLNRSAAHQVSPLRCDNEVSPEWCHVEEWTPDVSPDHSSPLHIKEEHDQRADERGPSCRQQCDPTVSPQFVRREGHEEPPLRLYEILTAEKTADIKAEPADELITSPSTREAEISCGIDPEASGLKRETLKDPLETTHHEQEGFDEQPYPEQDESPCPPDHNDPGPPQIKTFYTTEENIREAEEEGCKLSGLTRVTQPFYSVNPDNPAAQSDNRENTEGVTSGERTKELTPTGMRQKKRRNSTFHNEERDGIGVEEDVNDLIKERRHTCPICGKRFKESGHLKDHVRIHTGEKPYQCRECGVNFRQSGALTLHMRIHTGERPYQCTDCGRRFNRKGDMETHRVTHTGERPHLCVVCGKSFKRKSNLNTHLKIHAEDRMGYKSSL